MRILGIDPGLAATGWGLIVYPEGSSADVQWGAIRTKAGEPLAARLKLIHDSLQAVIAEHKPETVSVERIFFSRNVKTAIIVAQARGVALLATAESAAEIVEYTPNEIKKAVTGRGGAGKPQVKKMVAALLGLTEIPRPDHAADALAAAICHGHTLKTDRLLRLGGKAT